jgi:DNA-binding HxlR family transcriptional regulator
MPEERNWTLIPLLGEKYVIDILEDLLEGEKRFVDLADVCPNEKTRTVKLRKLEEAGLIETASLKTGKRFFVHYKLTEKGKTTLQELMKIENRYSLEED